MRRFIVIGAFVLMSFPAMAQDSLNNLNNAIGNLTKDLINDAYDQAADGINAANPQGQKQQTNSHVRATASSHVKGPNALNLTNGEIRNQNFSGRNLSGSSSTNTDFYNVNFDNVDFSGSRFSNTDFFNCTFKNAKFGNSTLTNVAFEGSDLRGASFVGGALTNVDFIKGTKMYGADLSRAKLTNVDYDGADFDTPIQVSSQKIEKALTSEPVDKRYHSTPNVNLAIQFEFDSDQLKGDAWGQLDQLASALKSPALSRSSFIIEGHTDAKGSDEYNVDLSYRRAITVRRALSEKFGVQSGRLQIKGYGEARPVADNDTDYGRALNRRVTIVKL